MADYLTLLARRTLGELRPVEPVGIHPYAESMPAYDGRLEASSAEHIGVGGAEAEARRNRSPSDERSSPRSLSEPDRPTNRSDRAAAEGDAEASAAGFDGHRGSDSPRWPRGAATQPAVGTEEGTTAASLATRQGSDGDDDLLPSRRPDRQAVRRGRGQFDDSMEPEGREGGKRSGSLSAKRPIERSDEAIAGAGQATRGDSEHDEPPTPSRVDVSIGTVEIRVAPPPSTPSTPRTRRVKPKLTLDDYLAQRRRGER